MNQSQKSNAKVRACLADGIPREPTEIAAACKMTSVTVRNVLRRWRREQADYLPENRIRVFDSVPHPHNGKLMARYQLSPEPDNYIEGSMPTALQSVSAETYKRDAVKKIDNRLKKMLSAMAPFKENVFRTSIVQLRAFQP